MKTLEELPPLSRLAVEVSTCAPLKSPRFERRSAYIPWRVVKAIRAQLEAEGYDWRAAATQYRKARGYR